MNNNSLGTIVLTSTILALCFLAVFYIFAWQEPSQTAPEANVSAPLNTGTTPQSKAGRITATEFYDYNDTNYYLNPSGSSNVKTICLGPTCRDTWPDVSVLTTYKMEAASEKIGNVYFQRQKQLSCPEGTQAITTYCTPVANTYTPAGWGYTVSVPTGCQCLVDGKTATLTATPVMVVHQSTCEAPCVPSYYLQSPCYCLFPSDCGLQSCGHASCQMEFQCGTKQTGGTYLLLECSFGLVSLTGTACNAAADSQYCADTCATNGWQHGSLVNCTPSIANNRSSERTTCGFKYNYYYCDPESGSCPADKHNVTCRCWND